MRVLTMILFAGVLSAQGPRGPRAQGAPPMDELKTYLGLNDTQLEQIRQTRQSFRESMRPLVQEMAAKQRTLRDQIAQGSPDAAAAGKLLVEIDALRKQIRAKHESAQSETAAVLTADQRAKLKALEDAAKLAPMIRQARGAGLLAPPEGMGAGGPGPGREGRPGRPMGRMGPRAVR